MLIPYAYVEPELENNQIFFGAEKFHIYYPNYS